MNVYVSLTSMVPESFYWKVCGFPCVLLCHFQAHPYYRWNPHEFISSYICHGTIAGISFAKHKNQRSVSVELIEGFKINKE